MRLNVGIPGAGLVARLIASDAGKLLVLSQFLPSRLVLSKLAEPVYL